MMLFICQWKFIMLMHISISLMHQHIFISRFIYTFIYILIKKLSSLASRTSEFYLFIATLFYHIIKLLQVHYIMLYIVRMTTSFQRYYFYIFSYTTLIHIIMFMCVPFMQQILHIVVLFCKHYKLRLFNYHKCYLAVNQR